MKRKLKLKKFLRIKLNNGAEMQTHQRKIPIAHELFDYGRDQSELRTPNLSTINGGNGDSGGAVDKMKPKIKLKIKPLATIQRCLIWLCMHPAEDTASIKQKRINATFTVIVLTVQMFLFTACLAFCWQFFSIDLTPCMLSGMVCVAFFGSTCMMAIAIIQMPHKMAGAFKDLTMIYEIYENEVSFRFLTRANNTCEWLAKVYFKYTVGLLVSVVAACPISIVYCWFTNGNLHANNFYHPARIIVPWNQATVLGYLAEFFLAVSGGFCYLIVIGPILLFFVSICIHHQAFYQMFKHSIDKIKESTSEERRCEAKFLCDLIRFHISVKDLFLSSAKNFSPFVTVQLICSTIILAVSIFYLDLQFHRIDYEVISAMGAFSVGVITVFLYCYFGAMASDSYAKMHDCIFELKWYELPIEHQKYFILMGANMQRPLHYHGFGVLYANLETFTRLLRNVFSYYGAIKTITAK